MSDPKLNEEEDVMDTKEDDSFSNSAEGSSEMDAKEDDSADSNSAEGSSDEEDADEERLVEIQKQLEASPYTYELHVQLISLCRKLGDLDQLRVAREKMNSIFPLTPELWLDWLTDEKTLATTPEQKEKLIQLFERAVKDYSSVSVWLEYVQFSIGNIGETWAESGLKAVRETFERAITSVGIHVTQGCLIWEAYREFETAYLQFLKNKNATEKEMKEQEDRIYNIFKRQLSVPLLDMDKTYKEFKDLFSDAERPDIKTIDFAYNKAIQKLNRLQAFEENLFGSEGPHYEEYKSYIDFEKSQGDPSRVQSIFERAVVENCLKEDLWLDYVKYMDRVVKIADMSLLVYERAVRNCPWSLQLWIKYGRALERYEQPHEKIAKIFETALTMGFSKEDDFREIWLGYLDYLRRKIKIEDSEESSNFKDIVDVFDRAVSQMEQYFWGSESHYVIVKYWIFFNAKYKKDIAAARQLWKDLIGCGHKEEARVWLDYSHFEKIYGDIQHYRKALLNALSCVNDWPETFVDLLLTFERQEGTLESFEKSEEKCESEMQVINQKRIKKMEETYSMKREDRRGGRSSKRQSPQFKNSRLENTKSDSNIPIQMDSEGFKIPPPPDKIHHVPEIKHENNSVGESENRKRSHEDADNPEPKKKKVETHENHGVTVKHDPTKDDRTVFLSNLAYDTDEEKIREFSSSAGEIEEIRLVKDFKGRSKGYCYVLYKSELDAKKALEKDREKINGRPVLVSPCEDRKNRSSSHNKLKFAYGLEKNKVFVRNVPFSVTEKEIEELFKDHGHIKSVRIVTYRNGHSKGLAYVEYEDEASAANAVVKMDGFKIQNKTISVAISNPPPRKNKYDYSGGSFSGSSSRSAKDEDSSTSKKESSNKGDNSNRNVKDDDSSTSRQENSNKDVSSSARSGSQFRPRGRGRTGISLLPRALARSTVGNKNVPNSSSSLQNGQKSDDSADSSPERKPLSNKDFAEMLKK